MSNKSLYKCRRYRLDQRRRYRRARESALLDLARSKVEKRFMLVVPPPAAKNKILHYEKVHAKAKRTRRKKEVVEEEVEEEEEEEEEEEVQKKKKRKKGMFFNELNESSFKPHRRPLCRKTSSYIGVSWYRAAHSWKAQIHHMGVDYYLGRFTNEKAAALAYDEKCIEFRGKNAILNFPEKLFAKKNELFAAKENVYCKKVS